ncbi:MAG: aspartyl/asparaginyl beta-hydroxylase domain-containing protein [Lysobacterales bacterium]|jgi:quercetin dioxygenase-like cupin family protein
MDIESSLRELGPVDSGPLIATVLAQDEQAWRAQQYRQNAYEVHNQTESLVMIFCNGWPELQVTKEPAWDLLKETAIPLMQTIIETHYAPGGTIIRAMAAKLKAGGVISPHRDSHPSFTHAHRIHIPVTTNPGVRFMINGRPHKLQVGQAYEINNQRNHSVMNAGSEDRITFIFDYVPPKEA